jgi:hypothetical protein
MSEGLGAPVRQRSPNYPSIDLGTALTRVALFEKAAGRSRSPYDATASYMGFTPTSSSALRCVAALVSFGLLEEEGTGKDRRLWLSDLGRRAILSPDNSPQRAEALLEAALKPRLHRELWDRYEGRLPADDVLKSYLRIELNFNENSVGAFIDELRTTIEIAKLTQDGRVVAASGATTDLLLGEGTGERTNPPTNPGRTPPVLLNESAYTVPMKDGGQAFIKFTSTLRRSDADRLKKLLEAMCEPDEEPKDEPVLKNDKAEGK